MKKSLLYSLSIALLLCGYASAFKVTVTPLGGKPVSDDRQKVTVSKADIIVDEDFSGFAVGVADDVRTSGADLMRPLQLRTHRPLAHPRRAVDRPQRVPGLSGCAGLRTINPHPAYINTPKMDYSGTIKVSFLCKALLTENAPQKHYHDGGRRYR